MIKPQIVMKYGLRTIILITVAAILSACSSPKPQKRQTAQNRFSLYSSQSEFETGVRNVQIKAKILKQYAGWKAVRYRFGGSSKKGVDCSAFVQLTFREQFGINLPRSTSEQQKIGKKIQRIKLHAGDLVLFRAGPTGRHVGIYLGNNKFVHASASIGVTISSLNDQYWHKRYYAGRRVLNSHRRS